MRRNTAQCLMMELNQWFSTWGISAPKGHLAMSRDVSAYHNRGGWRGAADI